MRCGTTAIAEVYATGHFVQSDRSLISLVLRPVYSDTTQLNSTDPVEQRTANQREASQSCFVYDVINGHMT